MFGYKNHAGIDRAHGFIQGWTVTSAAAHDGAQLRNVVTKDNTASTVWADSAYRSKTNEEWLKDNGLKSDFHQRKPKGKPMPETMSRANGRRSYTGTRSTPAASSMLCATPERSFPSTCFPVCPRSHGSM
ncbi:transposase [Sinorhizobium meliloti]|nr:transposase [Sinorhizobium meliloti]MDX0384170.1 transposase [Sinorhizobium meliloti]